MSINRSGSKNLIKIHIAGSLEQLKSQGSLGSFDPKNVKVRTAVSTLLKLYREANMYADKGDEEYAYILFMRYLSLIQLVQQAKEYRQEEVFFKSSIGVKNLTFAMKKLETLSISLEERYKQQRKEQELADQVEQSNILDALKPQSKAAIEQEKVLGIPLINGVPANLGVPQEHRTTENGTESRNSITSSALYTLTREKSTEFLIFDLRGASHFQESHIKHLNCFSIPEEFIKPGTTPSVIKRYLPETTKQIWDRRTRVDKIILYDWDSRATGPSSTIQNLLTLFLKWDRDFNTKTELLVLDRGYEDWLIKYPLLSTNSKTKKPEKSRTEIASFSKMVAEIDFEITVSPGKPKEEEIENIRSKGLLTNLPEFDRSKKPAVGIKDVLLENQNFLEDGEASLNRSSKTKTKSKAHSPGQWEEWRMKKERVAEEEIRKSLEEKENVYNEELPKHFYEESNKQDREAKQMFKSFANKTPGLQPSVKDVADVAEAKPWSSIKNQEDREKALALEVAKLREKRKQKEQDGSLPNPELDINRTISDISETKVNRSSNSPAGELYSALTPSSVNPVIDRKTKPITLQSSKYQGNGLVGMRNLGNTCYMNSALQCLLHLEDLRDYFLENYFRSDVNSNTMTQGNFAEGFADLFQSVWSGNLNSIVPTNFKKLVNAYRPDFRGNDQQDSDEFLVFLLDALHEDLNKVKKKQPMKEQENEGKTQSEASYVAFINWESSNKSKISDLFYGQEMSTLTCTTCRHSSIRFDMICALVVPIPNVVYHCRLQDCLSLYTEGESIADWNCPKCRRNSKESIKKLDLIRTPKILIVTLKRFSKDFQQWTKRQTFVEYPKTGLRISGSTYKLVATVNHFGTVNGGHYTASVYHPDLKVWHKYDDSEVSILREDDVISKEAYILFYSKLA
ncbi:ubiquitin carboxyl-terminal hydrolase 8-like isoform X1 [Artemia franciscana]|uniref:Ubiquitin carboxyl-terminal hydrolase n=3 Tax=Artemia franciscana TaxID=6661 RepID=A0AA88IF11_ARTSF|nr:hypothetical protein QYM36_007831 [Artemia franciscana]